jgi:hypothetical protein
VLTLGANNVLPDYDVTVDNARLDANTRDDVVNNLTLQNIATVAFDPKVDGQMQTFSILSVTEPKSSALELKAHAAELRAALQALLFSRTGRLALYFEGEFQRLVGRSTYLAGLLAALAEGPANLAAADALFQEAVQLANDGRFGDAAAKFRASFAVDPALGTLLGLAMAEERSGKTGSAYVHYRELADLYLVGGLK